MLPSLNHRDQYRTCESNIRRIDTLKEIAEGLGQKDDAAALDRFQSCWKSGLRRMKAADLMESTGIVGMQAGAMGFLPCLLTGNFVAIAACAGALVGGMLLHTAGILVGRGAPHRPLPATADTIVKIHYEELQAQGALQALESRKQSEHRVEEFRKTLEEMARTPPPPEAIVRGQGVLKIGGVTVPVRPTTQPPDAADAATPHCSQF